MKGAAFLKRIRRSFAISLAIGSFSTIASIVLIANPGYFKHDERQTIDHISRSGLLTYIRNSVRISSGANFGAPICPVSFLVEKLSALPMHHAPVIRHLPDVLLNAAFFFWLISYCEAFRRRPGASWPGSARRRRWRSQETALADPDAPGHLIPAAITGGTQIGRHYRSRRRCREKMFRARIR